MEKEMNAIHSHYLNSIQPFKHGLFVTINSFTTNHERPISWKQNDNFENKLNAASSSLNEFCYGAKYKLGEVRMQNIAALEIGKDTGRLHAHMLLLHDENCIRTPPQIVQYLTETWLPQYKFAKGKEAFWMTSYNPEKGSNALHYMMKQYGFFKFKYRMTNIVPLI